MRVRINWGWKILENYTEKVTVYFYNLGEENI